ncbi:formate dehydrogenase [Oxalobacteraceae bacterium CAVE-383]|nr:formate dehydrogenase [Oxalobacteraceae bacterium CAVE-383]
MTAHATETGGKPDNLIKMANQIGSFFDTMADRQQAQTDIAKHLRQFWAPRMRHALMAYFDQHGGAEFMAIVSDTLHSRRAAIIEANV